MKLMKKLGIYTLFAAIFAPQAQAMSALPKAARQVAAIAAKSPSIRTALTQVSKAGTQEISSVVPHVERRFMTSTQPGAKSTLIPVKPNTGAALVRPRSVSQGIAAGMPRSFNTSAVQAVSKSVPTQNLVARIPSQPIMQPMHVRQAFSTNVIKNAASGPIQSNPPIENLALSHVSMGELALNGLSAAIFDQLRVSYAVQNFSTLASSSDGLDFLSTLMDKNPASKDQFVSIAIQNVAVLVSTDRGLQMLSMLVDKNSAHGHKYINADFIRVLIERYPAVKEANLIRLLLDSNNERNSDSADVSLLAMKQDILGKFIRSETVTPTEVGFLYDYHSVKEKFKYQNLKQVVCDVIAIEQRYQDFYYTFTHGRKSQYNLMEMVYRKLFEKVKNIAVPGDFRFLYTQEFYPVSRHSRQLDREIYMNGNLFDNMRTRDRSSLAYFECNYNERLREWLRINGLEAMFSRIDEKELYEKNKAAFDEIEKEHEELYASKGHGELLVVAVPKNSVNKYVLGGTWGSYQFRYKDVSTLLDDRKQSPYLGNDEIEFILTMQEDVMLNPFSGLKIHSVNDVDPEKYAALEKKVDALMTKIAPGFKAAKQKQ